MDKSTHFNRIAILFWAIVLLAPVPGLSIYLSWLGDLEQYGYVFPLFIALIALILFRWDYQLRMPSDRYAVGLVVLSCCTSFVAALSVSPWLSAIAFAVGATAWLRTHLSSDEDHHRLTYLALLLVMTIRLPLNLDLELAAGLQRVTSKVSSYLLDSFSVPHYLRGNVIELPSGTLFVEEACSGVQSLFTVLFLVCLWIVFRRRPLIATPAYLLAGVLWAMVMNIVRITTIAVAQEWYAIDLSTGVAHEVLGWVCLLIATLMMLSTDRLLRIAFFPVPPDESGHLGNPVSQIWNRLLVFGVPEEINEINEAEIRERAESGVLSKTYGRGLLAGVLLLGIPSLAMGYRLVQTKFQVQVADDSRALLWDPEANLMSTTSYAGLITNHQSLRDANSKQLGNHADVWTVVIDGMPVRIAICQPYPDWHDMRLCYRGNGWQVNDWEPTVTPSEESALQESREMIRQWPISYAELVRDTGDFGTLFFCGLTRDEDLLSPPMAGLRSMFDGRMKDRGSLGSDIIMLQLWTETQQPVSPEQFEKLLQLFQSFRERVLDRLDPSDSESKQASSNLARAGLGRRQQ